VYDFLEIQERAALNAALPKNHQVTTTLKTDAKQDAGIRAIARYMKLPSNAGKRYSDLVGKVRAFVADCSMLEDPTITRLFPDAPRPAKDAKDAKDANTKNTKNKKKTLHHRMIKAIECGDVEAITSLAADFKSPDDVTDISELERTISSSGPTAFATLLSVGFLDLVGLPINDVVFSALSMQNKPLLMYVGADPRFEQAVDYITKPRIIGIFASTTRDEKTIDIALRAFGPRISGEARRVILDMAIENMNLPLAELMFSAL
jgi:hypothetical protein